MNGEKAVLTVTLNAAVDTTLLLRGALNVGASQTASEVLRLPGGKGVNVARVLHSLGLPVCALGLAGGTAAEIITSGLLTEGIEADFIPIQGASRTNIALVDTSKEGADPRVTEINEPGPTVTAAEGERFLAHLTDLLPGALAVVLSGSLPPGLPDDYYALLIARAHTAGVPVLLDTSGRALRPGLAADPLLIKPNEAEAAALIGFPIREADMPASMSALRALGANAVALTLGAEGAILSTAAGTWRGRVHVARALSPVGSGDAFLAGLLAGLLDTVHAAQGSTLARTLLDEAAVMRALGRAVASGAANTLRRGAGVIEAGDVAHLESLVEVTALPASPS